MPRTAWIGAGLFVLGVVGGMAAWLGGALHPDASLDLQARDALQSLIDPLEAELIRAAYDDEHQSALEGDLRGRELLATIGLEPDAFEASFPQVDPAALLLEQFSTEPMRYRLAYRGSVLATVESASRAELAVSPGARFTYRARHYEILWEPYRVPLAVLALAIALLGFWLATRGIFIGHLTRQLIAAAGAGACVLTLLLFIAASLQFVDRFSFLGPSFFLDNVGMLLMQAVPYTIAFGLLAGVTMIVGRMAAEREDIILKFNGISLKVLIVPILLVATLFSGLVFITAHFSEPEGRFQSDMIPYRSLAVLLDRLPSGAYALSDSALPFHLAYERRDGDRFTGVTLVFVVRDDEAPREERFRPHLVFLAEQARIEYSEALAEVRFRLTECEALRYEQWPQEMHPRSIHLSRLELRQSVFAAEGTLEAGPLRTGGGASGTDLPTNWLPQTPGASPPTRRTRTMALHDMQWHLAVREQALRNEQAAYDAFREAQRTREQQLAHLRAEQLEEIEAALERGEERLAGAAAALPLPEPPRPLDAEAVEALLDEVEPPLREPLGAALEPSLERLAQLEAEALPPEVSSGDIERRQNRLLRAEVEWSRRWAVSFAPFAFLLIAVPLGLLLRQGNLLVAFLATILTVLLVWFGVISWVERAAVEGLVPPWMVYVGPTASSALTGALLFVAALRISMLPRSLRKRLRHAQIEKRRRRAAKEAETDSVRLAATPSAPRLGRTVAGTASVSSQATDATSTGKTTAQASPWLPWRWPRLLRRALRRLGWRVPWLAVVSERAASLLFGTTIDRYVLRTGLVALVAAALIVGSLFVSIDYLVNADYFREAAELRNAQQAEVAKQAGETPPNVTPLRIAVEYYHVQMPQMLYFLAPLVMLVALGFSLVRMSRANEFLVMHVSGIAASRVVRPLLLLALLLGGGMLAYNEWVAPVLAEQMHEDGTFRDPRDRVRNRSLVDRDGQALYLQHYDVRRQEMHAGMLVRFREDGPPRLILAREARFLPPHGWVAREWREVSWVVEEYEGVRVRTPFTVSAGGALLVKQQDGVDAERAGALLGQPPEPTVRLLDGSDAESPPRAVLPANMPPADVNRRITQILADYSISELWQLSRDRPDWNAPKIMVHRAFIYPLGVLILFLIAVPLVLRTARHGGWYGLAICVLVGMGYFGLLIALTGWALYLQQTPPALILWGGISPLIVLGAWLYARIPT